MLCAFCFFFFFNDTATTEIYTLSLHDALPIYRPAFAVGRRGHYGCHHHAVLRAHHGFDVPGAGDVESDMGPDRKSTRLNSSHLVISYAVFCLKKKKRRQSNEAANDLRHPSSSQ